jgi:thiamine biosynthesis lipoprotein
VIERHRFRAMGTDVELLVEAPSEDAASAFPAVEDEFERLEQLLSRFRPDSDLSRLNREGRLVAAPDLVEITELALEARNRTGGSFDPTVHDAVIAAGYDRSFEDVAPEGDVAAPGAVCGGAVRVDRGTMTIELDSDVRLDFGGIGKGFAAERAAELLAVAGPCLVNAGGDVAVRGGSWPIGVETTDGTLTLELERGGLATSGRDRRRWRRGGEEQHHLIDPSTGRPAASSLLRVTVVAGDAVEAEVLAKSLFLAGEDEATAADADAVLVTADGRTIRTGGLR